jgi:DNA polymerase-1
MKNNNPTVYLVDASVYVFRGYFSLPHSMVDANGNPVNAVYGYGQFLCGLLEKEQPRYIAVAFDKSLTSSFRNEFYPDYKANRELPPEELERQFEWCERLTQAMGIRSFISTRFEADDLIATVVERLRPEGFRFVIVSTDKDLAQLIENDDRLWDGIDGPRLSPKAISEKFGVPANRIADYLALVGDSVDNIPGVPGIGPKAAQQLLQKFNSLQGVYEYIDQVPEINVRGAARLQKLLIEHRDQAFLSLQLATLHSGARIDCGAPRLIWQGVHSVGLKKLFKQLRFGERLLNRCLALENIK